MVDMPHLFRAVLCYIECYHCVFKHLFLYDAAVRNIYWVNLWRDSAFLSIVVIFVSLSYASNWYIAYNKSFHRKFNPMLSIFFPSIYLSLSIKNTDWIFVTNSHFIKYLCSIFILCFLSSKNILFKIFWFWIRCSVQN